jgi:hypothetical protein
MDDGRNERKARAGAPRRERLERRSSASFNCVAGAGGRGREKREESGGDVEEAVC